MSRRSAVPFALALALVTALASAGLWMSAAQAPRDVSHRAAQHFRPLPIDGGAAALWQSLHKLHTRASLLYFTAHPDDEDGGMLAYESRGQGARVALLTLNRGESGQNAMSDDYFDALGLVRTQELLSADRYYGVQQYFSTVVDYGFSKTKAQALQKWGHDRVLRDAVRVVRMTHPLVIASVFIGGPSDGHGNHQVAGEMAQEVFNAAGDPKMFPDQIQAGLRPWSPLKVYARVPVNAVTPKGIYDYATGAYINPVRFFDYVHQTWIAGVPSIQDEIPEGTYAPMLAGSYLQIARRGLGEQKSQNGGPNVPDAGPSSTPYHLFGSRVATPGASSGGQENSIFQGTDTSLTGIASLAPASDAATLKPALDHISALVDQATAAFSAVQPEKIAPILARGLAATNALIAQVNAASMPASAKDDVNFELKVKQTQFNDALTQALGLTVTATVAPAHTPGEGILGGFGGAQPTFQIAIPGQKFAVQVHVADSGTDPVRLASVALAGPAGEDWQFTPSSAPGTALAAASATDARIDVAVPQNAASTRPYYSRPNIGQAYYNIDQPQYIDLPNVPYPLAAWAHFTFNGVPFELGHLVETVKKVNGPGTVENPLIVAPAISVTLAKKAGIVPFNTKSFPLSVTIHSNVKGAASGTVQLQLPAGWTSTPETAAFHTANDGQDEPLAFRVFPRNLAAVPYTLTAVATYAGMTFKEGYVVTGYEGVRPYNLYVPATLRTTGVDVTVAPDLNVAYVTGAGDDVPEALEDLGVHVHFLSDQDIATANLSVYSAIVLGVRAYAARPALATFNDRLLNYVHNGGVLVVQYQTGEFDHNYGPYPLQLGGNPEKVMDEHSAVQILAPNSPVMSWPNKITDADFQGWMEERGHSFMTSWDPRYAALVEMHDPDQAPQKGGLLYATYGTGVYIYAGLAFYRQFTEGVPGAYRIFANFISAGKATQK
ncbi:MAG TPA: PIG-L family deacetylase [Terriglobales bacterium]